MNRTILVVITLVLGFSVAGGASPTDQIKCEQWRDGKCVKGPLTELAKSFAQRQSFSIKTTRAETCEKFCTDACPKCNYCSFCDFCDWYDDKACVGVSYYADRETCTEKKTKSCCDLCESQCEARGGACNPGGLCKGGNASTSPLIYCVETKTGEPCPACE